MGIKALTPAAARLEEYMSCLSEQAYSAGWMQHLEFALWHAVVTGPTTYGRLQIEQAHIDELQRLSKACKGWIYFDTKTEETWIPLKEWQQMYSRNIDSVSIK